MSFTQRRIRTRGHAGGTATPASAISVPWPGPKAPVVRNPSDLRYWWRGLGFEPTPSGYETSDGYVGRSCSAPHRRSAAISSDPLLPATPTKKSAGAQCHRCAMTSTAVVGWACARPIPGRCCPNTVATKSSGSGVGVPRGGAGSLERGGPGAWMWLTQTDVLRARPPSYLPRK